MFVHWCKTYWQLTLDVQMSAIFKKNLDATKIIVVNFSVRPYNPSSLVTSSVLLPQDPYKIPATSEAGILDVMLILSLCLLYEVFMCMCTYISVPHILVEFKSFTLSELECLESQ